MDLYLKSILKIQLQTKQPIIYSYFFGPVLNNKFFFANGKRLSIFVNQTIVESYSVMLAMLTFCIYNDITNNKVIFNSLFLE